MRRFGLLLCGIAILWSAPCHAQSWDPSWPEYGPADVVITTSFGALAIGSELVGGPRDPRWDREILLDLPIRKAIGSERDAGEHRAALVSDLTVSLLMAAPLADAAIAGWGVHRDHRLALNFGLFALESLAITFGATNLTKVLVGRSRPRVAECFSDPETPCESRPNVSFFSGHSSVAFTGAGLICAFGTVTPLHGEGFVGQIPCISALTVAATTAVLRLVANKHHTSDVVIGTLVGLASGWLLPAHRLRSR